MVAWSKGTRLIESGAATAAVDALTSTAAAKAHPVKAELKFKVVSPFMQSPVDSIEPSQAEQQSICPHGHCGDDGA